MSLLELAQEIKGAFNPATDKVNGADKIPQGEYDIVISNVKYAAYDSGWENVVVDCDITTGDLSGRKEIVSFSFIEEWNGKPISDFILGRNMKMAQKLAFIGNYEWLQSDFEDTQSIALALKSIIGTQAILTIKESQNKNDPANPFRSYEFDAYEQTPDFSRDANAPQEAPSNAMF